MLPELTGIGATPLARASLASVEKRCAPAISPISLPAVNGPKPGSASSCGATWATSSAISPSSALMVWESSRMRRSSSRAILTRVVCSARARRRADACRPLLVEQRAAGQLQLGPDVVQVPEQVVVERDADPDEPFAVIDEQPDVELNAGQLGDRQALQALAQRRPGDGDRVDAIGLAAITSAAPLARRQPRRDPHHPLAMDDQKPLKRPRDMPAILQSPKPARRPARVPNPAPRQSLALRPRPSARRPSPRSPAATAAIVCDRLCMSAPSTIMTLVPFTSTESGHPGGHGLLRAVPRSYQVTPGRPRPATSDTAKASQTQRPTA